MSSFGYALDEWSLVVLLLAATPPWVLGRRQRVRQDDAVDREGFDD